MQVQTEEIISITDVQRQAKNIFTKLSDGTRDKFCVMRNNVLAAVMLPAARYEALLDELDDLRLEAVARERLENFNPEKAISHEAMLEQFSVDE